MILKKKIVIFAYGFMGKSVYESLVKNNKFDIAGVILPNKNSLYTSSIDIKKSSKNTKTLYSDSKKKIYDFIKFINPDFVIISTFNKILNKEILELSKFINIHHGKLPKQKGRASINWALVMGRNNIFITIHEVNSKLDGGSILSQKKILILESDNYLSIQKKINLYLKSKFVKILIKYMKSKIIFKKNNKNYESWNCSRNPEDGMINFFDKRKNNLRLIRALYSKKFGAYCFLKEKKIMVIDAKISKKKFEGIIPGRITQINKNGSVECLCSDGPIVINKIIYKNKLIKPAKIIRSTRDTLLND